MLKNFWYACAFSSEITNKPKQIVMLKQKFVLYRNTKGQVVALKDQCPHRGAALSNGWVENDCIRCPYHGWKFSEKNGQCLDIPANAPEIPVPKKARVETYPIKEKYDFIWLFYGDLPEAQRPPIPTLPEYLFTDDFQPVSHSAVEAANYERLMEANIDFAHVIAVHKNSFGRRIPLKQEIKYPVVQDDWSAYASYRYDSLNQSKSILNSFLGGRPKLTIRLSFYLPSVTLAEINIGGDSKRAINFCTLVSFLPVDETTTVAKRVLYRNVFKQPWLDKLVAKLDHKLAYEDTVVVETLAAQTLPPISEEAHVAADALDLAYRRLREKYIARGWELKTYPAKSNNSNGHSISYLTSLVH